MRSLIAVALVLVFVPSLALAQADDASTGAPPSPPPEPAPAPSPPSEKPRVLVLDLDVSGVDAAQAKLINGLVTDSVARLPKYEVLSSADVRQLVQMEAEKSATGCDTSSCLAEVAGALGAQWVVFGNLGRLGNLTVVTLSLFDTRSAKAAGRQRVEVRDVEALPAALDNALATLMGEPLPPVVESPSGPSALLIGGAVTGGVAALVSLGATGYALVLDDGLSKPQTPAKDKQAALDNGPIAIGVAGVAAVVALGGAGLAGYAVWAE